MTINVSEEFVASVEGRVAAYRDDVGGIRLDVAGVAEKLAAMHSKVDDMQRALAECIERLEALEARGGLVKP